MNTAANSRQPIEAFLRILLLSLILTWCFLIARPFLVLVIWAVIISVAIYPIYNRLLKLLKRKWLALMTFAIIILVLFTIPSIKVAQSISNHAGDLQSFFQNPEAQLPAPDAKVQEWPLIGKQVYALWMEAKNGLEHFVSNHNEQVTGVVSWLLTGVANVMKDLLITLGSMALALVFLYFADGAFTGVNRFAKKVIGAQGETFVTTARDTIRSVVQGILLVAFIQAILIYVGLAVMGVEGAVIFAFLVLIIAIVQLPLTIITVPLAIYSFSVADTTPAIIFSVYMILVGLLDNFLKPILMGRGVSVPMIVVFVGSLGGMMLHGIIGLFVGAVVMAIGYQIYSLWLKSDEDEVAVSDAA